MANLLLSLVLLLPAKGMKALKMTKPTLNKRRFGEIEAVFGQAFESAFRQESGMPVTLPDAPHEHAGIVVEARAMGLSLLDCLKPQRRKRLTYLREQLNGKHGFNLHAGLGMALAKRGGKLEEGDLDSDCPLLRWIIVDGYGFGLGYFERARHLEERQIPEGLRGYMARAFDQGLGRSIWFHAEGNIETIGSVLKKFPAHRQSDLWSGVGTASAYSCAGEEVDFAVLKRESGRNAASLAVGVAFAAYIRQIAGNVTQNLERGTQVFWGDSAGNVAALVESVKQGLPGDAVLPAYAIWRQRLLAFVE